VAGRPDAIDERDVTIVQGTTPGLLPVNLYFDRQVAPARARRAVERNVGGAGADRDQLRRLPYGCGIQMPFTWTATQTYMQMTITLREVSANVPVDASRFAKPREYRARQPLKPGGRHFG